MRSNHGKTLQQVKKCIPLYIMILPGLIYLFINNYIPMTGIIVAFKKYNRQKGIYFSDWVGWDNFNYLIQNDAFVIIRNTFLYNVVFIILGTVAGAAKSSSVQYTNIDLLYSTNSSKDTVLY